MNSFNLPGVRVNSILVVETSEEFDCWCFNMSLLLVENESVFPCSLHQSSKAGIMLGFGFPMYSDVVSDSNASFTLFQDLVHPLLEDVLGADKSEGESKETVSAERAVECCKQAGIVVQDN